MSTAFISGHLDLTKEEFLLYYVPVIDVALANGDNFVVGDARGTDKMAQEYLAQHPDRVTVYHMFGFPRFNLRFITKGGFVSDNERDKAMTEASDYDIAWVRHGREDSGTARNISRREVGCKECGGTKGFHFHFCSEA